MIKDSDIAVKLPKKNNLIYMPAEMVVTMMYLITTNIHTEIPKSTLEAMRSNIPKIYVGLHKSLWETMGVPVVINLKRAEVPYIVTGNNLIGGEFEKALMRAIGCVFTERSEENISTQGITSALEITKKIRLLLEQGKSIYSMPMDGRSKNGEVPYFYSPPFDAALGAIKNSNYHTIIDIPVTVDYQKLNDIPRMIESIKTGEPYKFKVSHFKDWWKDLGDVYVTFGEPIEITASTNRKKINVYTLNSAKNNIKILAPNVLSAAVLTLGENRFNDKELLTCIDVYLNKLSKHSDKFVGFKNSLEVIANSGLTLKEPELAYKIYYGNIKHYL